jgi:hypothetical protein
MRLSDHRQNEPGAALTRQVMLGDLFLHLTGCNITGGNNPLTTPEDSGYPLDDPGELAPQSADVKITPTGARGYGRPDRQLPRGRAGRRA